MTPEQTDTLLSKQPSWMGMNAPVPAHIPGSSIPQRNPVFPGNQITYGDQGGGGGSEAGSGVPEGYVGKQVRAMILDGTSYTPASGYVLWKPA